MFGLKIIATQTKERSENSFEETRAAAACSRTVKHNQRMLRERLPYRGSGARGARSRAAPWRRNPSAARIRGTGALLELCTGSIRCRAGKSSVELGFGECVICLGRREQRRIGREFGWKAAGVVWLVWSGLVFRWETSTSRKRESRLGQMGVAIDAPLTLRFPLSAKGQSW
jgi:hypothetical protein